jgi:hypothetical protein
MNPRRKPKLNEAPFQMFGLVPVSKAVHSMMCQDHLTSRSRLEQGPDLVRDVRRRRRAASGEKREGGRYAGELRRARSGMEEDAAAAAKSSAHPAPRLHPRSSSSRCMRTPGSPHPGCRRLHRLWPSREAHPRSTHLVEGEGSWEDGRRGRSGGGQVAHFA